METFGVLRVCLLVVVVMQIVSSAEATPKNPPSLDVNEDVVRDFYDYLIQREAIASGQFPVQRRARPYQSLRLRFGKRSVETEG